jgi:4-amino-4-deoxy-L-arabinose transferase-like glycosyltransferase
MTFIKKNLVLVLFLFFLGLGAYLRADNLYTWPRLGATFDEYAWTWQGMNLIQNGVPSSWSPHPQYENFEQIVYQEAHFRIVTPFLEHPPLFGLTAGSFAILNGVENMLELHIRDIRSLALILGVISIGLVFLLTRELYDKKVALIAMLLYATIPTIAVGSRIVQNENFLIPMWLLSLYFVSRYIKEKRTIFRNLAAVICGLLVLAKIPWIAAAGSIFLIFLFLKKYKDAMLFIIAPFIGLSLFIVYGLSYDADLFIKLWGLQIARYDLTFTSFYALFQKPYLVDRFYLDGWIYFGWFAVVLLLPNIKKHFFIVLPLLSYFVIFMAGIPDEPGHGWYRYPFYPFLVISIALFIKEYFNKNHILTFLFLIMVGLSLLELTWSKTFGFSFFVFRGYIALSSISLLPIFFPKTKKISGYINYITLVIIFSLSVCSVLIYNEQ